MPEGTARERRPEIPRHLHPAWFTTLEPLNIATETKSSLAEGQPEQPERTRAAVSSYAWRATGYLEVGGSLTVPHPSRTRLPSFQVPPYAGSLQPPAQRVSNVM